LSRLIEPAEDDRGEHDVADDVGIVLVAQLGRGQVLGEMEGQHAEEAQDGQLSATTPLAIPMAGFSGPLWANNSFVSLTALDDLLHGSGIPCSCTIAIARS
jgi:hypothetical protein